jgi:hypothetical protein
LMPVQRAHRGGVPVTGSGLGRVEVHGVMKMLGSLGWQSANALRGTKPELWCGARRPRMPSCSPVSMLAW